ncbi:MAG: hypothetical protein IH840_02360 [Candidatus Heimdallarchaeota archaeon]|nr:hypothetical protein [Candidatus Heimdallarchaeota archaeon]
MGSRFLLVKYLSILLVASLFLNGIGSQSNDLSDYHISSTNIDQVSQVSFDDIIEDTLDILINRKNEQGSWNLPSTSIDTTKYYGIAGGMAGIGHQLLLIIEDYSLTTEIESTMLIIAREIGDELITTGNITATHATWPIAFDSEIIDFSWDFGISGISAYFSQLYNHTQTMFYKDTAEKAMNTVFDLIEVDSQLNFTFLPIDLITNTHWYPTSEAGFLLTYPNLGYTGVSLGISGVIKSILSLLQKTNFSPDDLFEERFNKIIDFLNSQSIINGPEVSFSSGIDQTLIVKSVGYGFGVFGIADTYYDLFKYLGNSSYFNMVEGIVNWANQTDSIFLRLLSGIEINGSEIRLMEYGYLNGYAGAGLVLAKIGQTENMRDYTNLAKGIVGWMLDSAKVSGDELQLPFAVKDGIPQSPGRNSWSAGETGMFELIHKVDGLYSDDRITLAASQLKNHLVSLTKTEGNRTSLMSVSTQKIENNPYFGMPSLIRPLFLDTIGVLSVQTEALDFSKVELGTVQIMSIELANIGDDEVVVSAFLSGSESIRIEGVSSDIQIPGRTIYSLSVSFSPTEERDNYLATIIIQSEIEEFTVVITGIGFDNPVLSIIPTLENGTPIDEVLSIDFDVVVSDSSPIQADSVTVSINGRAPIKLASSGVNIFAYTWSVAGLENGTYALVFRAADLFGNSDELKLVYTIGIYTPSLREEVFSDTTRNILFALIGVGLLAAVIVTVRYGRGK